MKMNFGIFFNEEQNLQIKSIFQMSHRIILFQIFIQQLFIDILLYVGHGGTRI